MVVVWNTFPSYSTDRAGPLDLALKRTVQVPFRTAPHLWIGCMFTSLVRPQNDHFFLGSSHYNWLLTLVSKSPPRKWMDDPIDLLEGPAGLWSQACPCFFLVGFTILPTAKTFTNQTWGYSFTPKNTYPKNGGWRPRFFDGLKSQLGCKQFKIGGEGGRKNMISIGLGYVKISIIIEFKTRYQNVLSILSSNSTSPLRKSPINGYQRREY